MSMHDDDHAMAADYVMGLLDETEQAVAERRLYGGCGVRQCGQRVAGTAGRFRCDRGTCRTKRCAVEFASRIRSRQRRLLPPPRLAI